MNELSKLRPPKGAHKNRKRIGRGPGSGTGKTSGRGQKGQRSRSGSGRRPGFEGGQMPLQRRVPKRGFTPRTRVQWAIVNLASLDRFEAGADVTPETLAAAGLIGKATAPVKILGQGEITQSLSIKAHKFSKSATSKLEAAGCQIEVIGGE